MPAVERFVYLDDVRVYIENNTLQDPFYEQVFKPLIFEENKRRGVLLPIVPDTRSKGDKFTRIEGTLEPINRAGLLVFNEKEANDPDMQRLMTQFKACSRTQKRMDGPDMVEGGVFLLKNRVFAEAAQSIYSVKRINTKKI